VHPLPGFRWPATCSSASLFVGEEALNIRQSLRHPPGNPVDGYFSVIANPLRSALTIAPT
jgi:hypothetical protein